MKFAAAFNQLYIPVISSTEALVTTKRIFSPGSEEAVPTSLKQNIDCDLFSQKFK